MGVAGRACLESLPIGFTEHVSSRLHTLVYISYDEHAQPRREHKGNEIAFLASQLYCDQVDDAERLFESWKKQEL